jgi:threonine aldolase
VTARKSFGSDNHAGAHEAVLQMIAHVNPGDTTPYGGDPWTQRACAEIQALLGARGDVFLVFTGTAANVLGLSLLLRPHEAVICPQSAHLNVDECGAVERVLGSRLLTVPAPDGKLTPALIASRLGDRGDVHRAQPRVAAISQVTEYGTCYTLEELRALRDVCRSEGLWLYADGARLANAAAWLGCSLADMAAFTDVLSFGATKNGAVGAEAVVVMAEDLVGAAPYQRKQQMQLPSKMRYLAAQFLGLLQGGLWLRNAAHANLMASRLADGLRSVPGVELWQKVESNAVFTSLQPAHIERLQREWHFYVWDEPANVVRWMTAFDTPEADVDAFAAAVRAAVASSP